MHRPELSLITHYVPASSTDILNQDLRRQLGKQLPDHTVKSVVYPKYETKGELAQASEAFLEW